MSWRRSSYCGDVHCVEASWRKSSYSPNGVLSDCVEARADGGSVLVRDSKNPDGPVLEFTPVEWEAFLAGARDGEFDLPLGAPQ